MTIGTAAIELVKESIKTIGLEIVWKNAKATMLYDKQLVATLHFGSSSLIIEPLDLANTQKENWRRFEYADPQFPESAIYYLQQMVSALAT